MSVALGKLNAPWGIEVIAFSENVRETFGASVNEKAPEGKDSNFSLLMKVTSWSLGNFDANWSGILVNLSLDTTVRLNKGLISSDEKPSNISLNLASSKDWATQWSATPESYS